MSLIKNLLVGVDLSDYSRLVVEQARELSRKLDAKLSFVYVFEDLNVYDQKFLETRSTIVDAFISEVKSKYALEENTNILVRFGDPADELLAVAKEFDSPLIVIGHRGKNALVRLFMGSTAEKLSLSSEIPLWIHRGDKTIQPERVLIPSDLTPRTDYVIEKISPFMDAYRIRVELLHVFPEPAPIIDDPSWLVAYGEMRADRVRRLKEFKAKHAQFKVEEAEGDPVTEIANYAKDFDFVAISPRESSKSEYSFGSVTASLVRYLDEPMLVLP